jgi:hypothetical protein
MFCALLLTIGQSLFGAVNPAQLNGTWTLVSCPSVPGVGQGLFGVTAISSSDAWAVGDVYNQTAGDQQTQVQHWDGTRWKIVTSPSVSKAYNHLTGVSGTSSNDVWAVGYTIDDRNATWRTLLLHWNGAQWGIMKTAKLGTSFSAFTRVMALARDDAWVVGYSGTNINFHTLAEHWDGQTWNVVPTPAPGLYDALYGISGTGANDLWAVGFYKTENEIYESLTLHWDGFAWSEVDSPNTTEYNWFNGVTATRPDDAWALGYEYEDGGSAIAHPLTQHWDGTDWSVIDTPAVPDGHYTNLADAAWLSSNDVVAVGTSTDQNDHYDPLIEEWNGTVWSLASVPELRGLPTTLLFAVASDKEGGYWAVGWAQKLSPLTFKNYIIRRVP